MRIPGPTDLLAAADSVLRGVSDGNERIRELADLVPRVIAMADRAEALLSRAEGLLERAEDVAARTEEVAEAADQTRARTDEVVGRAGALLERGEGMLGRGEAMLAPVESLAPRAMPILDELVSDISAAEVRAMKDLMDRLPALVEQLDAVGPDVHDILDAVQDLSHAMQGLPGMGALKRRGERRDAEEDAAQRSAGSGDAE